MKAVIIYYSLDGNTELIANMISKRIGSDLIKLRPKKEVAKEGFRKFFWGGKGVIFKDKPELLNEKIILDHYDTVIIGTPIWAGSFTPPILSFISSTPIKDKSIHIYSCSLGGGTEKCFQKLRELLKGNTVISTAEFVEPTKCDKSQVEQQVEQFCRSIKD